MKTGLSDGIDIASHGILPVGYQRCVVCSTHRTTLIYNVVEFACVLCMKSLHQSAFCYISTRSIWVLKSDIILKAGRLVSLAGCYAAIVIADNATFLLSVNCIASLRPHSAIIPNVIISSRGSAGRASVRVPPGARFYQMFVPTSAYTVGAELSCLGFG